MIFKTITLHNVFSYYGTCTFDLMPPTDQSGHIIIIMGRNGFGKTSFLNGVKLLFGGVTKELRQGVQRGSALSEKAFILGAKEWWGILNHQAKSRQDPVCYISAVLVDENNQEITVKRSWNLSDDNYQNTLEVTAPRKKPLIDDSAQQYLSSLLPLDYIPFFFFDAEEVGYLAEANNNQLIEKMEQLLNIRPADNIRDCIKELTKKIERESITPDANLKLMRAENQRNVLLLEQQNLSASLQNVVFDTDVLDNELREIKQKIRLFSGQGAIENNAKLEAEKLVEQRNQAEALTNLSEVFERDAFLRLNAKQVQKTMSVVDRCAHGQRGVSSEMLESLREPLKEIFTTPPYLNNQRLPEPQIIFYQKRIAKLLDSRDIDEEDDSPIRLDSWRAKKLPD
jgi:DNA sulfur modification protein DndD